MKRRFELDLTIIDGEDEASTLAGHGYVGAHSLVGSAGYELETDREKIDWAVAEFVGLLGKALNRKIEYTHMGDTFAIRLPDAVEEKS